MACSEKKNPLGDNNANIQGNYENSISFGGNDFDMIRRYSEDLVRQFHELREEQRRRNAMIIHEEEEECEEGKKPVEEEEDEEKETNDNACDMPIIKEESQYCVKSIEQKSEENSPSTNDQSLCNKKLLSKNEIIAATPLVIETKTPRMKSSLRQFQNPPKISITNCDHFTTPISFRSVPLIAQAPHSQPLPQTQPRIQCRVDMRPIYKSQSLTKQKPIKTLAFAKGYKKPATTTKAVGSTIAGGDVNKKSTNAVVNANVSETKALKDHTIREVFKSIVVNNVEYLVLNALGKGGSSIVYHCYNPKSKEECAVKCVDLNQDRNEVMGFINEVNTLERLQECDRIIKLHQYQILQKKRKLFVVLEKGGRDFSEILREHERKESHLPPFMIIYYWMQMLYAVQQIHSHGVIHSDLKPANFLETQEHLKLIDFGVSSCVQHDMTSVMKTVAHGTFGYISPEALCQDANTGSPSPKYKISFKSDVWSLGCILYQLIYKRTPFAHISQRHAKLAAIMDANHQIDYPLADWIPPRLLDCVKSCLKYDARSRPSIDDLIQQYQDFVNKF